MSLVIMNTKKRSMKGLILLLIICVIGIVAGIHFLLSGFSSEQPSESGTKQRAESRSKQHQKILVGSVDTFSFGSGSNTTSFKCITQIEYGPEKEENYQYTNKNSDDAQKIRESCIPM